MIGRLNRLTGRHQKHIGYRPLERKSKRKDHDFTERRRRRLPSSDMGMDDQPQYRQAYPGRDHLRRGDKLPGDKRFPGIARHKPQSRRERTLGLRFWMLVFLWVDG